MKCLLTGCNGFIAQNLIEYFPNLDITGLDQKASTLVPTLVQDVSATIEGEFDLIIHAASGFSDDKAMFNANFLGTKQCIEVAERSGCPLIYISSAEAYQPVRSYGILKLAGEFLVKNYFNGFIVRPFHIYGPKMNLRDGRIQSEILKALRYGTTLKMRGDGNALRSFTHVSDLLSAIDYIIRVGVPGLIYDVSNEDESISVVRLLDVLNINYTIGHEQHPIKESVGDSRLLRNLGWSVKITTISGFIDSSKTF